MFVCCRFPTAWSVTWKVKCAQETDNKVQGMHWECWSCFQRQLKWLSWWLTARPRGRGVKHNGQFGWCAAFGNQPCHGNQIVCGPLILSRFQNSKFRSCFGQIVWPIFTGIYFGQLDTHGLRYSCNNLTIPTSSTDISFASCEACGKDTDSKTNKQFFLVQAALWLSKVHHGREGGRVSYGSAVVDTKGRRLTGLSHTGGRRSLQYCNVDTHVHTNRQIKTPTNTTTATHTHTVTYLRQQKGPET